MTRYFCWLCAVSIIGISGCEMVGSPFDDREDSLKPLDGGIIFRLKKDMVGESGERPGVWLHMMTDREYSCCNWVVKSQSAAWGDNISVTIDGIQVPEICCHSVEPATYTYYFEIGNGNCRLEINYGDQSDAYTVVITDSAVMLTEMVSAFTTPFDSLLWTRPPRSFAYICSTTASHYDWICDDFLDTLTTVIEIAEFSFYSVQPPFADTSIRYFGFNDVSDFETAGEVLRSYAEDFVALSRDNRILLVSWKGEWFDSDMYR